MKNRSTQTPSLVEAYKKGTVLVNYDVTEVTVEREEGEEPLTEYEYTSVEVETPVDYSTLVSTMIREKYSPDAENAIVRKMIAIDLINDDSEKDTVRRDFAAYNEYAESCKTKARQIISELGNA